MEPLTVLLLNDFITEYDTEQAGDKRLIITIMNNFIKEEDEEDDNKYKYLCETTTRMCEGCSEEIEISICYEDECSSCCKYDTRDEIEKDGWNIFFSEYCDEYLCPHCSKIYDKCEKCGEYYDQNKQCFNGCEFCSNCRQFYEHCVCSDID